MKEKHKKLKGNDKREVFDKMKGKRTGNKEMMTLDANMVSQEVMKASIKSLKTKSKGPESPTGHKL